MKRLSNHLLISGIILSLTVLAAAGCRKNDDSNYTPVGSGATTTLNRTLIPVPVPAYPILNITEAAKFDQYGYGQFTYGPGVPCQKRFDLMPYGYTGESAKPSSALLRFFTVTDNHITDKESPCQAIFFAPFGGPSGINCYAPLILYTTQVFNATVQTINKLDTQKPFDLGLALGDMANNTQKNELDWFIRLMDGGHLIPSSGQQKPGTLPDYQQPYEAPGLHSTIPWYAVIGNHDHFWAGSKPVVDKIRNTLVGTHILQVGYALGAPSQMDLSLYSMGTIDGSTKYGNIIGCGVVDSLHTFPEIAADPDRRSLTINDWINEFRTSTSQPYGHGFVQSNPDNVLGACYSFIPKSDIPLKIIVLDDTQADNDPITQPDSLYGHGELTNDRYGWLMRQLYAGQAANQLMIIAAHVPLHVVTSPNPYSWITVPGCYNSEEDLVDSLQRFPNLILWVSGHRHINNVTALPSKTPFQPEKGFWEVETKSTREFPEQFRTFDIVCNSDTTISIIATNVDADMQDNTPASTGRKYAIASGQIYNTAPTLLETGSVSYNAELVKLLTPTMRKKIINCGKPVGN